MEKILIKILNRAIQTFLENNDEFKYETVLDKGLAPVAEALSIDRICIWLIYPENNTLYTKGIYRWDKYDIRFCQEEMMPRVFSQAVPRWEKIISKGESINEIVSDMPENEKKILLRGGAKSVLITPVFQNDQLAGMVLFQKMQSEQLFEFNAVGMLSSIGLLCFNTILIHNERLISKDKEISMESELKRQLTHQKLLTDISRTFVSGDDVPALMQNAMQQLGELVKAQRVVIVSMDYPCVVTRLEYSWYADKTPPLPFTEFNLLHLITDNFKESMPDTGGTQTFVCEDVLNHPDKKFHELIELGTRTFCWSPIYINGELWGLLSAENCDGPYAWPSNAVELIDSVSHILGGAIARDIIDRERVQALQQAVKASKAKGDFLSNMSHEMRTPMNAIIGMTHIGKNASDIERKDYALNKIEEASTHLLGVINDILDMSKIEANKLELVFNEYNFEKMLKKVVNAMGLRIEDKGQQFYINVDGRIPYYLIGDDQRIAQVIINLLSNATKFTQEGGTIRIYAELVAEENNICTIRIDVCDTGIGMSEEQISRLFTAFEQADSSTARKFGGTGLGLVISQRIVELMNGRISVTSVQGEGSRFSFTFKSQRGAENNEQWLDPSVNWKTMQVLVVDDAPDIREYLAAVFDRIGVFCDTATNGQEALDMVNEHGMYNIYFVDWRMPIMDGIEFTRIIKSREKEGDHKSVVIMISSTEWSLIKDEAAAAGVDKYLLKPLFASNIVDCLNSCLGPPRVKETVKMEIGPGEFKGCRFMLVEDVEINREIFLAIMEESGAEIISAENGSEALRMFIENPEAYDVILMDVQMPEMDGLEATRLIRSYPHLYAAEIPIIAMTANVFKEDIEECLAAGMSDHLGKPLNMDEVFKKLRQYVCRKYE